MSDNICQDAQAAAAPPPVESQKNRPPSVTKLFQAVLDELHESADQRFKWVVQAQQDYIEWEKRRKVTDQKLGTLLESLKADGWEEQAEELAARLAAHKLVTKPGQFDLLWTTGRGVERMVIAIKGRETDTESSASSSYRSAESGEDDDGSSESGTEPPTAVARGGKSAAADHTGEIACRPDLFPPSDVDVVHTDPHSVTLRQAAQWITRTKSGSAFCITCSCADVLAPTLSLDPDEATHRLVPASFYMDPLQQATLDHFKTKHGTDLDAVGLLREHGRKGTSGPWPFRRANHC